MCAPTRERQVALRRAAVGVAWQVVALVADVDAATDRLAAARGRVLVVDAAVPGAGSGEVAARVRNAAPGVLLVGIGEVAGTDAGVAAEEPGRLPDVLADVLHAGGDHPH
ncbi:MAG TPA: hypothetical protein VK923_18940 [Euzebyales bacterium]|nr:hypothetical protein [Euzebyales bacterium]